MERAEEGERERRKVVGKEGWDEGENYYGV